MARVLGTVVVRDTRDPRQTTYWRAVMTDRRVGTAGAGSTYATEYAFREEGDRRWRETGWSSVPKYVYREMRERLRGQLGSRRDPSGDDERVDEIARGMLARYRTPEVAAEMAWHHAMDYWTPRKDDARFLHWQAVSQRIKELSRQRRNG